MGPRSRPAWARPRPPSSGRSPRARDGGDAAPARQPQTGHRHDGDARPGEGGPDGARSGHPAEGPHGGQRGHERHRFLRGRRAHLGMEKDVAAEAVSAGSPFFPRFLSTGGCAAIFLSYAAPPPPPPPFSRVPPPPRKKKKKKKKKKS